MRGQTVYVFTKEYPSLGVGSVLHPGVKVNSYLKGLINHGLTLPQQLSHSDTLFTLTVLSGGIYHWPVRYI